MKVLKSKEFGSITLGAAVVKIIQRKNEFEVKYSQGTSARSRVLSNLENAEEIFKDYCEMALKLNGPFVGLEYIRYDLDNGSVEYDNIEQGCDYHGNNEPRFSEYRLRYFAQIWSGKPGKVIKVRHIKNGKTLTEVEL